MDKRESLRFIYIIPVICVTFLLLSFVIINNVTQNSGVVMPEPFIDTSEKPFRIIYAGPSAEIYITPSQRLPANAINDNILNTLSMLSLPNQIQERIRSDLTENGSFSNELLAVLEDDQRYWTLVDKNNSLNSNYVPHDLVDLTTGRPGIETNRMLRRAAYEAVKEMTEAAAIDGHTLTVLSAYRSFEYQGRIYIYWVLREGRMEADRISARPGYSQHQLGLAVDFNMFDNALAKTPEGIWLAANASRFGWSLSYPEGLEGVTGYSWESWHYRYVGIKLTQFIDRYFDGIQQYALMFINEFNRNILFSTGTGINF